MESVDTALVTKRREQALQDVDARIGKVQVELDDAKAPADLRNQCLQPLHSLRRQVETQPSIAHINQARQGAVEAEDVAFEKIEVAGKQEDKGGSVRRRPRYTSRSGASCRRRGLRPRPFSKLKQTWTPT